MSRVAVYRVVRAWIVFDADAGHCNFTVLGRFAYAFPVHNGMCHVSYQEKTPVGSQKIELVLIHIAPVGFPTLFYKNTS